MIKKRKGQNTQQSQAIEAATPFRSLFQACAVKDKWIFYANTVVFFICFHQEPN